jgi:hypothetical protein
MSAQQNRAPQARTESRSTSVANGSSRSGVGGVGGTGNQDVVHDMTNPAMVEAVHDSAALGPAEQINDLGAMQPFTQLDRMVEQSIPTSRNEEAIRIVEQELGANLDDNAIIHLDRYANVVAGTYNAEAVVIGQDVYVHRQVEERVVDILYPPQLFDNEGPTTDGDELTEPDKRPPWARHEDSEIVVTPGGYTIEMKDHEVTVYDRNEDIVTRIWGDPHVDEGGNGDDWHFGQDSTFILPDGAKICLDTKANQHGWWFVVGVDIIFGYTRFHYGVGDSAGMHNDGQEWDAAHADQADDKSAGTFFLQSNGQWAKLNADGSVTDVTSESWGGYQKTGDVTSGPEQAVGLTRAQWDAMDLKDQISVLKKEGRYNDRPAPGHWS